MDLTHINWLAVLAGTVASFAIGGIWYGPLFGKRWQQLVGLSDEDLQRRHPATIFGPAFLLTLVQAITLAALIPAGAGVGGGALLGAALGTGLIAAAFGVNYLFSGYPRGLFLIDALFNIVQLAVIGAILGAWP